MSQNKVTGCITKYSVNGRDYSSYIIGENLEDVRHKIDLRGIDESIEGWSSEINPIPSYNSLSDSDFIDKLPEIIHAYCYMSFVAVRGKLLSINEVLGDEGLLHELIHLLNHPKDVIQLKKVRVLIGKVEDSFIGFY